MQIGWNMVIETTNGIVGLWTCWLGNSIKLFYPLNVNIPDEIIMETLGVTLAKPVAKPFAQNSTLLHTFLLLQNAGIKKRKAAKNTFYTHL